MPTHHIHLNGVIETVSTSFAWDSTTEDVGSVPAGSLVLDAYTVVETAFNSASPDISLGDKTDANAIYPAGTIDLLTTGITKTTYNKLVSSATDFETTITADEATAGSGKIYITYIRGGS